MVNTASLITSITPEFSSKGKPHWRRTQQVYSVLNEAPLEATYNQLIQLVKEKTGQGCSRKLISKWKKERANQYETVIVPELQAEIIPFVIPSQKKSIFRYVIAASTIIMSLAGCSYLPIITKRPPIIDDNPTSAVAQTPVTTPKKSQQLEPREIKIELTLTNPQELKIKPGEQLTPGQVLSDRTVERQRLLNQRKQLELSLLKLDTPIPTITSVSVISPLQQLPKISYHFEQANISLKQQELKEAKAAIALSYEKIKQLEELLPKSLEKTQQSAFVVSSSNLTNSFNPEKRQFSASPRTISALFVDRQSKPVTFDLKANFLLPSSITQSQSEHSIALIIEHEQAILRQLQNHQEKARLQLQIAQSQLIAAKERRTQEEYQLHLEENRRAIALQNQQLELERQRTIRAGQLQEQEYSKAQIQAKLQEVDNALAQLSTVKAPYSGTVKKVKWKGQSDHTLLVELTLDVDDSSENRTATLSR